MKVYKHESYSYVDIVEVPKTEIKKIDLCMCSQPKETLGNFYNGQEEKPDVLMNAGFFGTSSGNSCFNIVDDGVVYSTDTKYKWGMGIPANHTELRYGCVSMPSYGLVDFVSGYPNLVDNGVSCAPWTFATEINYNALRSMIGYNKDSVFFVTVSKPGMKFTAMANLMIEIGCTHAVNLDGGGSSRLMVGGEVINTPTENRAVDSVFALWLTDEAKDEYYGEDDYYIYTVVKGDSWWKIAANELGNGSLYTKLQEYNNWPSNKSLQPGQEINIPKNKFQEEEPTPEPDPTPTPEPTPDPEPTPEPDPEPTPEPITERLVMSMYVCSDGSFVYKDADGKVISTFKY